MALIKATFLTTAVDSGALAHLLLAGTVELNRAVHAINAKILVPQSKGFCLNP
jgi:hypothetical protein